MSRNLVDMKSDLISHILEVLNSQDKILPSIENAIASSREVRNAKWGLRSGGRHPDKVVQMTEKSDLKSQKQHRGKSDQQAQELEEAFPRLIATQKDHYRENLKNPDVGDDDGYDTPNKVCVEVERNPCPQTCIANTPILFSI